MSLTKGNNKAVVDLTSGSIVKGMITFAVPVFLGQLLQQFYNMADAWVVGNFADNDAFAAVSSAAFREMRTASPGAVDTRMV